MKMLSFRAATPLALALLFAFNSGGSALACAACYGDTSGDKMGTAATWGIFAMVVIMFAMLGTLVGCGFYLNYRAKHPLPDYDELLSETEDHPESGASD